MNRFLLLALTAGLLSPVAAKAESHWLVITYSSSHGRTMNTIEMESAGGCESEGKRWINSPTHEDHPSKRDFHCVVGK